LGGTGAESVTIAGNRNIRIMLGNGRQTFKDHATTLWLVSPRRTATNTAGLLPFGWTCIEAMTSDKKELISQLENEYQKQAAIDAEKKVQAEKQRIDRENEARRKQAADQARRDQEKKKGS
jgi:hypothetical protein